LLPRNPHFTLLEPTYLFQKIQERADLYPKEELLNLSIGDVSLPISKECSATLAEEAQRLSHTITGYGPSRGSHRLAEALQQTYYPMLDPNEIYISDGAKCDIGRLQILLGNNLRLGIQDPTYPVYADTARILGNERITLLPCTKESDYFPNLDELPEIDVLFLCSPNNPTGAVATRAQLERLVQLARSRRFLIIFDSAYSDFIQDPGLPKSIYEIEGADEVAIETSSFSKSFGFTGLRLGWCVVPKKLKDREGRPLYLDWERVIATFFNGPSCLVQCGGLAALSKKGLEARDQTINEYLSRAQQLKNALSPLEVTGGENSPYLWVSVPQKNSWEAFEALLENAQILSIPGSGFGASGGGYIRLSAFSKSCTTAAQRVQAIGVSSCLDLPQLSVPQPI